MNSLLKVLSLIALLIPIPMAVADGSALACDVGPVERQINASAWNIYACGDGKSVVVVPVVVKNGQFGYFFVTPKGHGVTVVGEGWGKDSSFQPVFKQLQQFTASELAAIVLAAHSAKPATSQAR
jgi:hypothetical protein